MSSFNSINSINYQNLPNYNNNINDNSLPPGVPIPPGVSIPPGNTAPQPQASSPPEVFQQEIGGNNQNVPKKNPADKFSTILKTNQEKLPAILDDFKKYYVFLNKNPNYDEYRRIFENLKSNLNEIDNEIFKLSNTVDTNITETTRKLLEYNKLIEKEKIKNEKLKSIFSQYDNQYNGSKEMINNFKEIYNLNYLRNVFMLFGIIGGSIILLKIFTKIKK